MNPIITRNNVALQLANFKILKGDNKDTEYPAPPVTPANWEQIVEWYGQANIVNVVQNDLKRRFQIIYSDCRNEDTGEVNWELFTKYGTDLSAAGLNMKEILGKLDELQARSMQLIDSGDFSEEVRNELKELNNEVKAYRQMREDRARKPKAEKEAEPALAV